MSLKVRRVVTGHDAQGRAVVLIDETAKNVKSSRPGAASCNVWLTDEWPIGSDGNADPSGRQIGTTVPDGTVFRVVRYEPGVVPRRHRTDSIDYAVVISGEIDMELDDQVVTLKAGDVLVQRATVHNWINRGPEPCVIAFILVSAKPATLNGAPLSAHG
jgi:quercetin dioxygenase-like cupin family protein